MEMSDILYAPTIADDRDREIFTAFELFIHDCIFGGSLIEAAANRHFHTIFPNCNAYATAVRYFKPSISLLINHLAFRHALETYAKTKNFEACKTNVWKSVPGNTYNTYTGYTFKDIVGATNNYWLNTRCKSYIELFEIYGSVIRRIEDDAIERGLHPQYAPHVKNMRGIYYISKILLGAYGAYEVMDKMRNIALLFSNGRSTDVIMKHFLSKGIVFEDI